MTTELLSDPPGPAAATERAAEPGKVRRVASLAVQYGWLSFLALIVLAPLVMTIMLAMSNISAYVNEGAPFRPVAVQWKDRTWFTGGAFSVVARTLSIVLVLAWVQRIGSPFTSFRDAGKIFTPRRLIAVIGGTIALAVTMGPVYQAFHGNTGGARSTMIIATLAVAAMQFIGFWDPAHRGPIPAAISAVVVAALVVLAATIFVGGTVWTQSWGNAGLGDAMIRSLVMSVLVTVLQVVTSILAAYAFVFLEFPFKRLLFVLTLATLLLPLEVTLLANQALIRQLEWSDTMQALVLPFGASAMGIFLLRQGFRGIPKDIRDACRLDGHGHFKFLFGFAVPLVRPVVASFTVISALSAWNQYLWPRAVVDSPSANTLQLALTTGIGANAANFNIPIAAALVSSVPVLLVLVAFQRHVVRGLTAGAVK